MNSAMPRHDRQGAEQCSSRSGSTTAVRLSGDTGHECCGSTTVRGRTDAS
jgi:hypothetical protein